MITFHSVSKTYAKEIGVKAHTALAGLSFTVQQGETIGLIGANGAGKSTAIKLLMDFIRPTSGKIELLGATPANPRLRRKIGYLPEVANFPANLTVLDLLRFTATACGMKNDQWLQRGRELLDMLELWDARKRPLCTYSKGMQQRANFAIALINDAELLILDEPMSGLDPMGRRKIIDLIGQLQQSGKTILFCSHILEDVDRLVNRVLVLHKGKKIFDGSPGSLTSVHGCDSFVDAYLALVQREVAVNG